VRTRLDASACHKGTTTEITEKILVYTEITVSFFTLEGRPEESALRTAPLVLALRQTVVSV
jgi:hypothetical protein